MEVVCLALQARRSITAWGNAPRVWSQNAFSAESAIQRGPPFVLECEQEVTEETEKQFSAMSVSSL